MLCWKYWLILTCNSFLYAFFFSCLDFFLRIQILLAMVQASLTKSHLKVKYAAAITSYSCKTSFCHHFAAFEPQMYFVVKLDAPGACRFSSWHVFLSFDQHTSIIHEYTVVNSAIFCTFYQGTVDYSAIFWANNYFFNAQERGQIIHCAGLHTYINIILYARLFSQILHHIHFCTITTILV